MFEKFGQIANLMRNLPKLKEDMAQFQQKIGQITAEGTAGGGMITVKVNGHMEVVSCQISEDTFKDNDKEMLEDLVKAAANQAIRKCRELVAEETQKMASGLGLPPGMDLPGLSQE